MGPYDVQQAITSLRLIFWGGLICIIDFKINNFDLLHDTIGTILIAVGVFRLAKATVHDRYAAVMTGVKVVALISVASSVVQSFVTPGFALAIAVQLFGLVQLAAIVLFCLAMQWFALEAGLSRSAQSWRTTLVLMVTLLVAPMAVIYLIVLSVNLGTGAPNIQLPMAVVLIVIVFIIPVIHFFISTSRMKREAATGGSYTGRAFPVIPLEQPTQTP